MNPNQDPNRNPNPHEDVYIRGDNGGGDFRPPKSEGDSGFNWKKTAIILGVIIVIIIFSWLIIRLSSGSRQGELIEVDNSGDNKPVAQESLNNGEVSPITGLSCENWDRRPIAVMQPADVSARPAAGFSEADMVIEMPVITASITRLMGVYICGEPEEVGSMRSSRHDFIHLAKGLDAIFVHWGGSVYAKEKLNEGVIENINCNNDGGQSGGHCCFRKSGMRGVDSGYAKFDKLLECSQDFDYRMTSNFSGYPHQADISEDERPESGNLRVGFAGAFGVNYEYNKEDNSYLRFWGGEEDYDRNNGKRHAPKNVVVVMAKSEQIVEGDQYNNVEIGDPWYDSIESGDAYYYFNGQEMIGKWRKDSANASSKLKFLDENGNEVKFVPGQIWVEVLEPGQGLKWTPGEEVDEK